MKERFVISYCSILDSVFVIDSLGRMPLTSIHSQLSVHGLDCNDRDYAEKVQRYYENVCGFQRPLIQEVTSFEIRIEMTTRGTFRDKGDEIPHYDLYDNTGRHVIGSYEKEIVYEFKEWLDSEVKK
jgi:hypothetical protein